MPGGAGPASGGTSPEWSEDHAGRPTWPASAGLLGLVVAATGTLLLVGFVSVGYLVVGVDHPSEADSFDFLAIAAQSFVFVATALAMTGGAGAREFGFRPFRPSAIGWALLALVGYFILSAIYVSLAKPPQDDLPQQLGAEKSTALAVITGFFVVAVAPAVEEFFFRGFLYQALRNRIGVVGGAVASGSIFSAIHFKPEFFVPLAILGFSLALLFEKTGSLWPCILVHALNNSIAFAVTL